ncbi:MAG: DUF2238 domain-containing protein [Alphaproteobacteria bacterium]|nr:DUF2238 domain-containing protein [Alphaproteobacteria bacterium]
MTESSAFAPRTRWVLLFVLAYVGVAIGWAIVSGNSEFVFYSLAVVVFIAIVAYMDRRVTFSQLALWGLAAWGLLHLAGGQMSIPAELTEPGKSSVLYNLRLAPFLPKYDQVIHAYGFGISVVVAHEALSAHFKRTLPINWPLGAALFLIGLGLGAVNEIIEFTLVLVVPETNVGGYRNTGWDLVSNGVGALAAVFALKARNRPPISPD